MNSSNCSAPRIQTSSSLHCRRRRELISPLAEGRAAELLLSAHAMEILARAMLALQGNKKVGLLSDQKRLRLQAVGDQI